jgi:N-acetylneuraminic acid mutarotase
MDPRKTIILPIHFVTTLFVMASMPVIAHSNDATAKWQFDWKPLKPLPFKLGLKGHYALSLGERHWLFGGSAFPSPAQDGGAKTYFDAIYQLTIDAGGNAMWQVIEQSLPEPLAEGTSVALKDGAVFVGGQNNTHISASVQKVSWCSQTNLLVFSELPDLPVPVFHAAAAVMGNLLFVAGGHDGKAGIHNFWALDLADTASGWQSLPQWPGPQRFGATLAVLEQGKETFLYLFSGKSASTQPRSQDNYLRDVYRFDPVSGEWARMRDMPHAALIGIPAKLDDHTLAIFSGSDGKDIERLEEIGDAYRLPNHVQIYSAASDTWSFANEMPIGLIGVPMLKSEVGFILAGGEYSPGLRSPNTYMITPNPPASHETR